MNKLFHGVDVNQLLKIQGRKGYGVSLALAKGEELETFCSGSGRFGQDFPVNPDMLFQAASISKPMFAMTVLRYVDKGIIDLDADISDVISDFVKGPPLLGEEHRPDYRCRFICSTNTTVSPPYS